MMNDTIILDSSSNQLASIAFNFFVVLFFISTIILPFLIYTILTQSTKDMGSFKVFLCLEIFWSYFFGMYLSLIHPVVYFPHIMGRITGPINILCNEHGCNLVIEMLFFIGTGYAQSLFCIVLFRLWLLTPMSIAYKFNNRLRVLVLLFALLMPTIVYVTPVVLARVDIHKGLNYLVKDHPELEFLKNYTSQLVIYNNPENNDFWINYIVGLISITMVAIVIGSIFLFSISTYLTYQKKLEMSKERFRMSLMLLKTTILQVFLGIMLLAVPLCTAFGIVMSQYKYAQNIVFIAGMVSSTHSTIEFCCIIYMVKHYRNYLIKRVAKLQSKLFGYQQRYAHSTQAFSRKFSNNFKIFRISSVSSQQGIVLDT